MNFFNEQIRKYQIESILGEGEWDGKLRKLGEAFYCGNAYIGKIKPSTYHSYFRLWTY